MGVSYQRVHQLLKWAQVRTKPGASYGLLGKVVGLSRQRVARIIGGE
jgi:hypothetical protein